jgi:stage II sporulation protein GA (sporulation sigma-E factor processing peptidase)
MFFPKVLFFYTFPFKLIVSVIMIKIVCPSARFLKLAKYTAVFYLVSFTFAGILLALVYFGNMSSQSPYSFASGIFYFNISPKLILCASAICYVIMWASSAIFRRNKILGIKTLKITVADKTCEIAALSDTGNLLTDPITGEAVVIAETKHLEKLFPNGIPDIENIEQATLKMRLIPYSSLGNPQGMLTGFIPDEVTISARFVMEVAYKKTPTATKAEITAITFLHKGNGLGLKFTLRGGGSGRGLKSSEISSVSAVLPLQQ